MNFMQRLYDKIRYWKAPSWFVDLMQDLQDVFIATLKRITMEQLQAIKDKILEVQGNYSGGNDPDGTKRFKEVYNYIKGRFPGLKDSTLNSVINNVVLTFKDKGIL